LAFIRQDIEYLKEQVVAVSKKQRHFILLVKALKKNITMRHSLNIFLRCFSMFCKTDERESMIFGGGLVVSCERVIK